MSKTLTIEKTNLVAFTFNVNIIDDIPQITGGEAIYQRLLEDGSALDLKTCPLNLLVLTDRINWIGANLLGWTDPPLAVANLAGLMIESIQDLANDVEELVMLPPTTPLNLYAEYDSENNKITLSWIDVVTPADSYSIKRAENNGEYSIIGTSTTNSYEDTNITNNTTYKYTVFATNAYGNSLDCTEFSITT